MKDETTREMLDALRAAHRYYLANLEESGGCDHSVGICCCEDRHVAEWIGDLIDRAGKETSESINCGVIGCTNRSHEGVFINGTCRPCYEFITTGKENNSQASRNYYLAREYLNQIRNLRTHELLNLSSTISNLSIRARGIQEELKKDE